jgi:hypothetical protein
MIFDDMITDGISKSTQQTTIDKIFIQGRHSGISIIISTQKYRYLNQNMRCLNCSDLVIFSGTASEDLSQISQEHSGHLDKKQLLTFLKQYLNEKYKFVLLDNRADMKDRFKDNKFRYIDIKFD